MSVLRSISKRDIRRILLESKVIERAVGKAEVQLHGLRQSVNDAADEAIDIIRHDPRFRDKVRENVIKSAVFRRYVHKELLKYLEVASYHELGI